MQWVNPYECDNALRSLSTLKIGGFDKSVLVEEFIEGRDISMIYIEGLGVFGSCVVECDAKFYDYEMKSIKNNAVDINQLKGDYSELKDIVRYIVKKLDIKRYAKIDFRESACKFYLIEVNAQVSFHPNGEFITSPNI